jgi:hypothetical protein
MIENKTYLTDYFFEPRQLVDFIWWILGLNKMKKNYITCPKCFGEGYYESEYNSTIRNVICKMCKGVKRVIAIKDK